eukprot:g64383.t1
MKRSGQTPNAITRNVSFDVKKIRMKVIFDDRNEYCVQDKRLNAITRNFSFNRSGQTHNAITSNFSFERSGHTPNAITRNFSLRVQDKRLTQSLGISRFRSKNYISSVQDKRLTQLLEISSLRTNA